MPPFEAATGLTPAGILLKSLIDIDAASEWGFTQDLGDITSRQFAALRIFKYEKLRRENELNQQSQ